MGNTCDRRATILVGLNLRGPTRLRHNRRAAYSNGRFGLTGAIGVCRFRRGLKNLSV